MQQRRKRNNQNWREKSRFHSTHIRTGEYETLINCLELILLSNIACIAGVEGVGDREEGKKGRGRGRGDPSLFPFYLPPPPPLFAPAKQAKVTPLKHDHVPP